MDFSARATTKDAARSRRRRSCTPPRSSSTLPHQLGSEPREPFGAPVRGSKLKRDVLSLYVA